MQPRYRCSSTNTSTSISTICIGRSALPSYSSGVVSLLCDFALRSSCRSMVEGNFLVTSPKSSQLSTVDAGKLSQGEQASAHARLDGSGQTWHKHPALIRLSRESHNSSGFWMAYACVDSKTPHHITIPGAEHPIRRQICPNVHLKRLTNGCMTCAV